MPIEATVEAVQRVRALVDALGYPVSFPVEVRTSWRGWRHHPVDRLGPGHRLDHRCTCTNGVPYEDYFNGVESIMVDLDGRRPTGASCRRTPADLAPVYPRWDEFQELRARLDPSGVFQNAALDRVLGPLGG